MLSLKVDTKALLQESEEIRLRTRELMQQTQQAAQPGRTDGAERVQVGD